METQQRPDRNLAMELMRATEAAALAGGRWMGRGDKNAADGAAVEAMRVVLSTVAMDGIVVIGEGEKDNAPMLFNGEEIGDGSAPAMDIAVDPIDGTTLTSLGVSCGSISGASCCSASSAANWATNTTGSPESNPSPASPSP